MRPQDLAALRIPSDPTLSPDGRRVAVSLSRLDLDADTYVSEIVGGDVDGDEALRALTRGPRDVAPAYAPDGRHLAFLRTEKGGKPQVWLLPADGGEPWRLTDLPLGVESFVWSPDATRLALVARVPEEGRYGTATDVPPEKEPPRRITTLNYRLDDIGWTIDRRQHVFVIEAVEDATPHQLTTGDTDHSDPAWSPDGRLLAFVAARHPERDIDLRSDVWLVAADGSDVAPRQLTRTELEPTRPAFTPDGETVLFCSIGPFAGPGELAGRTTGLWRVPSDASAAPERLTDEEGIELEAWTTSAAPLRVDGDVLVSDSHRGAVRLLSFDVENGAQPTVVLAGPFTVEGYDRAGDVLAVVRSDDTSAGEVWVRSGSGAWRQRSDVGAELAKAVPLAAMKERTADAPDDYPVHGWVLTPPGPGPFPVVLMIHGGPYTQYGWRLFDEAQVAVGAGYAVLMCNPRGAQGYGQAHGRSIVGRMGTDDAADLLAFLDDALTDERLDAERVGVMGGSYGGYMTTWLLGATDRFRTGITERALNVFDSFMGSSDIGWFFPAAYPGGDAEAMAAQSPLTHADSIDAPTLIVHSEEDWRCPLEQAQRLYVHLKLRGVDTELLVFPGEGHELSRSGTPRHRVQRFEAILAWLDRHLKPRP